MRRIRDRKATWSKLWLILIILAVMLAIFGFLSRINTAKKDVVVAVVDGETVVLKSGMKIKLSDISSPDQGESGYQLAKDFLSLILVNQTVEIKYETSQADQEGRYSAKIFLQCSSTLEKYCRNKKMSLSEVMVGERLAKKVN